VTWAGAGVETVWYIRGRGRLERRQRGEPMVTLSGQAIPAVARGAAMYLAIVQFLFATSWTIYVIYLPQLAQSVGIPRELVIGILLLDQLTFAITDFALGWAADRVNRLIGRIGPAILAVTAVSCLCFFALPHIALLGPGSPATTGMFLVAILLWVVSSSVLRAPPWVVIVQHAANPSVPLLSAIVFIGVSLAACTSSYIGVALRNVDPRLPFAISSVTLFVVTVGVVWLERALERVPAPDPAQEAQSSTAAQVREARYIPPLFYFATAILALGFQANIAFAVFAQYARFDANLDYVLPLFWVAFNLMSFPATALTPRWGGPMVMALGAGLGVLGTVIATFAPNLPLTILGQMLAGGSWGVLFTAGLSTAVWLGRTGHEGSSLGLWFSMQSVATFLRIGIVMSQLDRTPRFEELAFWLAPICWLVGGALLAGVAAQTVAARSRLSPRTS
jgi:Na+/melibiose symporter-like transporter